jgi:hypothetical protein
MQEGMGRIVDRNKEFLVSADIAIVRARRRILGVVHSSESLARFRKSIDSGHLYGARPLDIVSEYGDVDDFLKHFEDRLLWKEDKQAELNT